MGLRRAHCYRWNSPAYTRVSNNPSDSFITGIPGIKITRFDMGDVNGDWEVRVDLICDANIQIRHNATEASRQTCVRYLEKNLGKKGFHFKIRPYPHHIMRENKMATGAGADRVQSGMRDSFGKPVGKTARVHKGQIIMSVSLPADKVDIGKEALRKANTKLPGHTHIEVVKLKEVSKQDAS
jgi:large subunit ribosomal protein L10e